MTTENKWQKIETAPKTGEVILLLTLNDDFGRQVNEVNTGYWGSRGLGFEKKFEWCSNGCVDEFLTFKPDMWHPLPKLPATKKEGE